MSRVNIFEQLANQHDYEKDAERIVMLFDEEHCIGTPSRPLTLKDFVDYYCFEDWPNRGKCLNADDFLETLGFDEDLSGYTPDSVEDFLTLIEIIYNFYFMAGRHIGNNVLSQISFLKPYSLLKKMMDDCLSEYNQKAFYFEEEEKCIIAEDSPQVTAAAEVSTPDIALEIVRYHHRQLAGDIAKKKAILKALGDELEGRKKEISSINATLYNNITAALNNLNIRHNNINPNNKSNYHKAVAEMSSEELEKHYDDLYQLILLAILEMDNVRRQHEMKELIQAVTGK